MDHTESKIEITACLERSRKFIKEKLMRSEHWSQLLYPSFQIQTKVKMSKVQYVRSVCSYALFYSSNPSKCLVKGSIILPNIVMDSDSMFPLTQFYHLLKRTIVDRRAVCTRIILPIGIVQDTVHHLTNICDTNPRAPPWSIKSCIHVVDVFKILHALKNAEPKQNKMASFHNINWSSSVN